MKFIENNTYTLQTDYLDKVFAEIMYMTQNEMDEMMQLRLSLPKESRQTVHERCLERTKRIREKVLIQIHL